MACLAMNNTPGAILAALLAFDTTSRHSNMAMIDWIADFLAARGVASRRFYDPSGGKANLYARLGPSGGGGVMLSGHTDVVPVDGQDWSVPPFSLTERDGRYYGRGSADMKGFLACVLAAVDDFLAAPLRMPLHLAFSYDEEVGCLGVRSLVDFLQASPEKPALCLIGEPTEMQPVFGHKANWPCAAALRARPAIRLCPAGVNAIRYAARLINRLDRLGERLARQLDSRFSPPFSTLQVGTIQGGAALNIVPQSCRFDFEIRYLPGMRPEAVTEALAAYAAAAAAGDAPGRRRKRHPVSAVEPLPAAAQRSTVRLRPLAGAVVRQRSVFHRGVGTEGGLFDEMGVATLSAGRAAWPRP